MFFDGLRAADHAQSTHSPVLSLHHCSIFKQPLQVGRSLEEGRDEFVGHGCLVWPALIDRVFCILLTTMSTALTVCNDQ